jgi:hypothetical protein
MKKIAAIMTLSVITFLSGCKKDSEFLDVQPFNLLTPEQAFSDAAFVTTIVADLYNRVYDIQAFDNSWESFIDPGEAIASVNNIHYTQSRNGWGYGEWGLWDYGYIRELNLFIERATAATALSESEKKRFIAEGRFLRAVQYFEMVKRMGGVPLITKSLTYDYSGDATYLQNPRAKESEVYDFVISEMDAVKTDLPTSNDVSDAKTRATKGTAMAVKARAALYAASIAKYGATTPNVMLPGGEVGIPANLATGYYTAALSAAKEIISGSVGSYGLYTKLLATNPAQNFANLFIDNADKNGNPEIIWMEDYKTRSGKTHGFTIQNQPIYGGEEVEGGRIDPSLNFVQTFEKLDNTFAPLPIEDAAGNPIYYDNPLQLFADRDARLAGTVVLPGSFGRNRTVDIWAGWLLGDGSIVSGSVRGATGTLGGNPGVQLVGNDGPVNGGEYTAQTGFYLRKFVEPNVGAGSRGTGSEVPWIRYRYAEVLLNAAEAAFELGNTGEAVGYINQLRTRAGFTTPLTAAELTWDRIVNERRVELAFEGHFIYDRKRWRNAHIVFDGAPISNEEELTANIGAANKRNTQAYSLWPYKTYNPGSANDNKWVFRIQRNGNVTGANRFQFGNYYSEIGGGVLANNPKLVRQPNQ